MTPMMKQYLEIKSDYPDTLLMFRLGDFYELFMEDAKTASSVLEITLTGRDAGSEGRIPMCGVPFHSAEQYIARLINEGYSVAVCEQTEDPKQAKGLVKREVVRVVTPGTALPDMGAANRFLAALVAKDGRFGITFVDVGTGEIYVDEYDDERQCLEQFASWYPVELLVYEDMWKDLETTELARWLNEQKIPVTKRVPGRRQEAALQEIILQQYGLSSLTPLDLENANQAAAALGFALQYIQQTQRLDLTHLRQPSRIRQLRVMQLDKTALTNLEVLETVRMRRQTGSLYGLLHRTKTAMGSRLLKRWLERPLLDVGAIRQRQEAVAILVDNLFLRNHLQSALQEVYDLERLAGRVSFGSANARDLLAIAHSLLQVPEATGVLAEQSVPLFAQLLEGIPDLTSLAEEILSTLVSEPPVSVRDGGLIAEGIDDVLDDMRVLSGSGKTWLANLEHKERERTGIKSLKVGYNKVFGYYIEVSKANLQLVPPEYERRQTLSSAERYVLPELKEQEAKILHADENAMRREYELFVSLRDKVLAALTQVQQIADVLAQVDVLCALAVVSVDGGYVRPTVQEERGIAIESGRHPVVEAQMKGDFVPNDVVLDNQRQLLLITGPNMAGKSTFMRQTALIVILAHIGCFVPAQAATIGLVDRIFTRIGASDDLSAGQSTFMVEMVELAQVLRQGTERSLVLLDEIGRGTSTYDGLCIAEAVMETLSENEAALTLFATHYHELTETAATMPRVANASVLVQEDGDAISFLHTVVNRPADRSYGIQVARLAGVPLTVIQRAQELLKLREATGDNLFVHQGRLEIEEEVMAQAETAAANSTQAELTVSHDGLFENHNSLQNHDFLQDLAHVDVMKLTPLEALNELHRFVERAKEVSTWDKSK